LFEPAGHGKRKRRHNYYAGVVGNQSYHYRLDDSHDNGGNEIPHAEALTSRYNTTPTQFAKFNENIEYTVLMPAGTFLSA
jgi:hypothetical protein